MARAAGAVPRARAAACGAAAGGAHAGAEPLSCLASPPLTCVPVCCADKCCAAPLLPHSRQLQRLNQTPGISQGSQCCGQQDTRREQTRRHTGIGAHGLGAALQVHQARLLLQVEAPGADLADGAPATLLDAAAAVWSQAARVVTVSDFHRDVAATLAAMGIQCAS